METTPTPVEEVLWRPTLELCEDDWTKPPTRQFRLCTVCRNIMSSTDAVLRLLVGGDGVQLCSGSSQETQCSLRIMILRFFADHYGDQIDDRECAFITGQFKAGGKHPLDIQRLSIRRRKYEPRGLFKEAHLKI